MLTDSIIYTKFNGGKNMATITLSLPEEFEEVKKKHPVTNWNEVVKAGILRRLEELKKFEKLKKEGEL